MMDDLIPKKLHTFCAAMRAADWCGSIVVAGATLDIEQTEVVILTNGTYMIRAIAKLDAETKQ